MHTVFVDKNVASLFKNKGFQPNSIMHYDGDKPVYGKNNTGHHLLVPTYQDAINWFRLKHKIDISPRRIKTISDDKGYRNIFDFVILKNGVILYKSDKKWYNYHTALNKALEKGFELIK
jgi:hypothetical protein